MASLRRKATLPVISVLIIAVCFSARAAEITSQEKFLGFKVGAEYKLATYEQVAGYLELLASQSPRIKVFDMGPTSMGKRQKYAVISSDENMKNLDRYKEIAKKLSLARGVSEADARTLAKEGKAVAWIDGGLHATEIVGSHQQIQLAYDLVTGEDERTRLIRDNVITMLMWTNPDGMTMVADWYKKNLGTNYEWSQLPWLWQKYAGHDNNRDSHMANLVETQNTHKLVYHEWFPVVYYCQHQAAPFPTRIQISPPGDPANPNVHPLVRWWENIIGPTAGRALEELGLTGAITGTMLDFYYAGTVNAIAEQHNIAALLTETASGVGAPAAQFSFGTSHNDLLARFPDEYKDLVPGQNYPSPWKGGWWRFSDQIQYNLVVSKALLELVAMQKPNFLFDQWRMATDNIERFKKEPPYGWIISAAQRDPNTTALLLDRFLLEGLEIYQSDETFTHEGVAYPKGSYIVPTSQPYGLWAKSLLERQDFPDLRKYPSIWQMRSRPERFRDEKGEELLPLLVPLENAGWTMPLLMGIDSQVMSTPLKVSMHQLKES